MTKRRPALAVGAVAVVDRALLLVRRANPPERGRWTIPGGRVEPGETLAEAVEREVAEETGVTVRCGPLLGWVERIGTGHHFVILDFTVMLLAPDGPRPRVVAGGDALEASWFPLGEVPALELVGGLEEFLRTHQVLS